MSPKHYETLLPFAVALGVERTNLHKRIRALGLRDDDEEE